MTNNLIKKLSYRDFEKRYGEKMSSYVKDRIEKYDFRYRDATKDERDGFIRRNIDVLLDQNIVTAGEHRREDWEGGWGENYTEYSKNNSIESIKPKYFGKYPCVRWNQDYIIPMTEDFEKNSLAFIQDLLFDKYLRNTKSIYEFGCGTGHNLLRIREINKLATLWGLDWAKSSQKIINQMRDSGLDNNIYSANFDFFKPDNQFSIDDNAACITIAALEQVGTNFRPFIDYLLKKKPDICVHIEPIFELLDCNNLLDYTSIKYFQKRQYLWGLLNYLHDLENKGRINILEARRSYIGSLFIDGYSIIAWKPIR
jgi:hypothetical protein